MNHWAAGELQPASTPQAAFSAGPARHFAGTAGD